MPSRLQHRRQQHTQPIEPGRQIADAVTGPEGVTQRASSFSRRDAVIDLTTRSAVLAGSAADVALRVEALVRHLLRDERVVPVLAPGPRTSSELLRVRDATGRIVRIVDQSECRYTTVDLLAAETELLHRATSRQHADVALVPRGIVDQVLAANPTLRDRQAAAAVEVLRAQGAVSDHHASPVEAWAAMVDDWVAHRAKGDEVLMLATERVAVADVNRLARARLLANGDISRLSRTYRAPDDHRAIALAVGDEVILRRNHRIAQPDDTTVAVRNGMTGRITATRRRSLTVELDAAHRAPGGPSDITLPAGYVGDHVDYSYARTVDTAQGATVDHCLFAPSTGSSAERAYVALSRGRLTNRIYATRAGAWIDAIGRSRSHVAVTDREPGIGNAPHVTLRRQAIAHDREHPAPLELDM